MTFFMLTYSSLNIQNVPYNSPKQYTTKTQIPSGAYFLYPFSCPNTTNAALRNPDQHPCVCAYLHVMCIHEDIWHSML